MSNAEGMMEGSPPPLVVGMTSPLIPAYILSTPPCVIQKLDNSHISWGRKKSLRGTLA